MLFSSLAFTEQSSQGHNLQQPLASETSAAMGGATEGAQPFQNKILQYKIPKDFLPVPNHHISSAILSTSTLSLSRLNRSCGIKHQKQSITSRDILKAFNFTIETLLLMNLLFLKTIGPIKNLTHSFL